MAVIGTAQGASIVISIIRMKLLALMLGPTGVGLLSIYSSLQDMSSQVAGLGVNSSAVREIASTRGDEVTLSRVRCVLMGAHLIQGGLAMAVIWILREPISIWLFGDEFRASEVGLIGVAVFLTLVSLAQTALLQGLRRIDDLGRLTVLSALVASISGLWAVWILRTSGLIWFVLVSPLTSMIIAFYFVRRLPTLAVKDLPIATIWSIWKPMAKLGLAFMLGGLASTATLLIVRGQIAHDLGLSEAGQFAAAWSITMTYVGFMFTAMAADYYPRLSEVIKDRTATIALMNMQAQFGLAIGGPFLLLLIGSAPVLVPLMYSSEFLSAVELLQWQAVGNVFKIAAWALGLAVVASARSMVFILLQLSFNVPFLLMLFPTLSYLGVLAAGPAFTIAYALHFLATWASVRYLHGFRWQSPTLGLLMLHVGLASGLLILALYHPLAATVISPVLALGAGIIGLRIVVAKTGSETRLARVFSRVGWPVGDN